MAAQDEEIPGDILQEAEIANISTLPEKSKQLYLKAYTAFDKWMTERKVFKPSEPALIVYFKELTEKYKSSTIWCRYSMLRTMISLKHDIRIQDYPKLQALLKNNSKGYQPKKSMVLTHDQIGEFLKTAPNSKYLAVKVSKI